MFPKGLNNSDKLAKKTKTTFFEFLIDNPNKSAR